jgi:hypothetical protein
LGSDAALGAAAVFFLFLFLEPNPIKTALAMFRNVSRPKTAHSQFAPSGPNYNPGPIAGLRPEELDFLRGYLNGMHDNNFTKVTGCPSSSGVDTVTRHCVATTTLNAPAGGRVSMMITGIPEAPIIYTTNAASANIRVVPYANAPNPAQDPTAYTSDFLKTHGVGRYRCATLAVRIDDLTAPMYRKGSIYAARNPSAVDITPVLDVAPGAAANAYITLGIRAVESLPVTDTDVASLSANMYTGNMEDGLYAPLPYMEPLNPFINRDAPERKGVWGIATHDDDINTGVLYKANILGVKLSTNPNIFLPRSDDGVGGSLIVNNNIPCHPENMQSLAIYMAGLDAVNSSMRVTVTSTWEYVTSVGTDWADLIHPPMASNHKLLLIASEVFRGMPAAYHAKANSWNEIWSRFKELYSNVSPYADKLIGYLPPQYAAPAAAAKSLLDTVTDAKKEIKKAETKAIQEIQSTPSPAPSSKGRRRG